MIESESREGLLDIKVTTEKLDASNAESMKQQFKELSLEGVTKARINLSQVDFLDSSGVGVLLSFYKTIQARSVAVVLHQPTPSVLSVLELLRLHRIFTIEME
jgi:anti-sigma B factor antagonist